MIKLIYTSTRDQTVELHSNPFRLYKVEGLGDVGADIQMQRAPYQDGSTFIDSVLGNRHITIELKITGQNEIDFLNKKKEFASIFNPKLGLGKLQYVDVSGTREIQAVAESVPFYPSGNANRGKTFQKVMLNLICPDPYWRSTTVTEKPAFEPRFRFPFSGPFIMGVQRTDRIIINDGDAPAPIRIDFYGPADSPMIENRTTGEFIRINKRLEENEVLKIDTADGVKSVVFVDEEGHETNVFNWIDLSSAFFKLDIGENDITCNCAISNNAKDFDIYYGKLFNAV